MQKENQAFDIIVLAGQSNAQGSGIGPVTEEYVPTEKVYCLTGKEKHRRELKNLEKFFLMRLWVCLLSIA